MPSAGEIAVETYIRAWQERDPVARAALLEACFAADGRMVTRGREIRGRAALADAMAQFHSRTQIRGIRLTSVIDAIGTTFRFQGVVEDNDGSLAESFDAGEFDAAGRISLLLTFAGPLEPAAG